ncbi:MAG: retroviral-like aspartic protease family protein [Pseudomonadota bacterium]|nr:retroviral-like aspartic protease family protein [Pseudomonadota bacterium]
MMFRFVSKMGLAALTISLALSSPIFGQPPDPGATKAGPEADAVDVGIGHDRRDRMTVPISIDGKGPYDFLIDTGAERTIISAELARELALAEGRRARMHSMSGVGDVETVIIPKLQVSRKSVAGIHAPALRAANIGASGMLGIDSLQSQRITFDFQRKKMTVVPSNSREPDDDPNEIVVRARSRLGRLVLVDASLDGQKLIVILDTGAEVTVGNDALRRKLVSKRKMGVTIPIQLISVTGGVIQADYTQVRQVRLGGVRIQDLPVAFAEVHPFKQLDLADRPALLLGMDALRLFDRVSVDFANRKVRFMAPELSGFGGSTRMAAFAGELKSGQ